MTYVHVMQPGSGTPLVLLHGTGGDERAFLEVGRAIAPGAPMLSLRGDVDERGAARFFRRTGEGVYDMADLAERTAALDAFLGAALVEHGLNNAVGVGYSNGANILANLSFTAPDRLKRLVLLHPLIPFDPHFAAEARGLNVLITAGRNDPICPPDRTEALKHAYAGAGAQVGLAWHEGGHELRMDEIDAARRFVGG